MTQKEAIELLHSIKEYMDDRADISIHDPEAPNAEMRFSLQIDRLIQSLEEKHEPEIVPIGTKVRVTKSLHGHCCNIGQEVKICNYDVEDEVRPYMAFSSDVMSLDVHWLSREEFEIIEP